MDIKAKHTYDHYRFCYDNGHQEFLDKAQKCFDSWEGRQWDEADRVARERARRPVLTFNMVEAMVRSMVGVQRALRNDVRYIPVSDATLDDARVRDMIWMHIQSQNQFEFVEMDVFQKGLIMSRAYYEVRVCYDNSFQGSVLITSPRSQDIILDPSVEVYDPDKWPRTFKRRWVSYNDVLEMYGKEKADTVGLSSVPSFFDYEDKFMAQQMGRLPYYYTGGYIESPSVRAHLLIEHQFYEYKTKEVFVDVETGDFSEVPNSWDRDQISNVLQTVPGVAVHKRKVRSIRWQVVVDDHVMHDDDSPYEHFTIVPYFPSFVDGAAKGAVESLIDPQRAYNKLTSSEVEVVSSVANSGYKVKTGSLRNMTAEQLEARGAEPGVVFELADVNDLEKIQPNNIPQGYDRLSGKAEAMLQQLAGMSPAGRGFSGEYASSSAILQTQASQEINFAGWLANLHRSKQILASRVMDLVRSHYTETRLMKINMGTALAPQMQDVTLNEVTVEGTVLNDVTKGRYSTTLVPSPSRTSLTEADFDLLLRLRTEVGVQIPDAMLIELSPAANKAQIIQMLQGDSNERDAQQQEAEARIQQLEEQLMQARADKDAAAAQLNQARAQKALVDSQRDPDEAWRMVEQERIASSERVQQQKLALQATSHKDNLAAKLVDISERSKVKSTNQPPSAGKPTRKGVKK